MYNNATIILRGILMKFNADNHIHIALPEKEMNDEQIAARLTLYKDSGVTFLRDGGDKYGVSTRAKAIAADMSISYVTPAFPIFKEGHYGAFIGKAYSDLDSFKALVDEAISEGADFIKIMASGIVDFNNYGVLLDGKNKQQVAIIEEIKVPEISHDNCDDEHNHDHEHEHNGEHDELGNSADELDGHTFKAALYKKEEPAISADELTEMVEYCHSKGFSVMCHCNGAVNIKAAIEAGVDTIEHGFYMDEECAGMLAESDIVWVPTVAPVAALVNTDNKDNAKDVINQKVLKQILTEHIKMINRVWYLGGMIALGTDAGCKGADHLDAIEAEYNYLKAAINDQEFDDHLKMSLAQIEWKFTSSF